MPDDRDAPLSREEWRSWAELMLDQTTDCELSDTDLMEDLTERLRNLALFQGRERFKARQDA